MSTPYRMHRLFKMNRIPGMESAGPKGVRRYGPPLLIGLLITTACGVESSESADKPAERVYSAHYHVTIDPVASTADVALDIEQSQYLLRELNFPAITADYSDFSADGDLDIDDGSLQWRLPADGGTLRWRVRIAQRRGDDAYDALLDPGWGIFRAEDIIPRARTRTLKNSRARTTLSFDLPARWSVITEYSGVTDPIIVRRPERSFDQPAGWIAMGKIGVRREIIAGVRVSVAGPEGHDVRRMDMLALLNWTLPELIALLPKSPPRLTIVSAGDPMWRGGLSAPASLYIHASRPLISENATSTLLHEVFHTAGSIRADRETDWITEGLAEYYSLELLKRGGAITKRRHATAIAEQANWAKRADSLCGKSSTGATTALAVTLFSALDREIAETTSGAANLDDVVRRLFTEKRLIDIAVLTDIVVDITGQPSDVLHIENLPGCSRITPD